MSREPLAIGCAQARGRPDGRRRAGLDTLIARGGPAVLIFEVLAERTLALAQLERRADPDRGYAPLHGGDAGAGPGAVPRPRHPDRQQLQPKADPRAARAGSVEWPWSEASRRCGWRSSRGTTCATRGPRLLARAISRPEHATHNLLRANAYLGAAAIAEALRADAQVVVTGRVADPSLAVGPAMGHFGWGEMDWDRAGLRHHRRTPDRVPGAGHRRAISRIRASRTCPISTRSDSRSCEIEAEGALDGREGGRDRRTGGPPHGEGATPLRDARPGRLRHARRRGGHLRGRGGTGRPGPGRGPRGARPGRGAETLKVLAFFAGGWLGEGEISYAGPNAEARARLAADVIRRRMGEGWRVRYDLIGVLSVFGDDGGRALGRLAPGRRRDVRLPGRDGHPDRARVGGPVAAR